MQTSAVPDLAHTPGLAHGPDLAHTHTGPLHWLATATAMAAVIAVTGLLQPDPATATLPAHTHTAAAPGTTPTPAAAPDADAVTYPLTCAGAPTVIAHTATGDLDGDGTPETIAAAHCQAGSGTPPHGLYVLTHSRDTHTPRIVATLVDPAEGVSTAQLAVRDGTITATLLGYSTPDVPRCCPDRRDTVNWRWTGGTFLRTAGAAG
ncbi:hypothetical protein [Streptomyces sp. TRM64462]|uniref:hypothetical protein n=1 Tax=Streptomyces sp. TRM64462 TaxID=2741726 RepID=UPI001585EE27|nr:hypothetical protein [Streptomyces sp. TRM64462]